MITKVDVTLAELKQAISYAELNGQGVDKFITLHIEKNPVIDTIGVSKNWTDEPVWLVDEGLSRYTIERGEDG